MRHILAVIRTVACSGVLSAVVTGHAWSTPVNYSFVDMGTTIGALPVAINDFGLVAFGGFHQPDPQQAFLALFVHSGVDRTARFIDANPFNQLEISWPMAVNNAGQIAAFRRTGLSGHTLELFRVDPDGTLTSYAEADNSPGSTALLREFGDHVSMNSSGEMAFLAQHQDGSFTIYKATPASLQEIATTGGDIVTMTSPSINEAGFVAFTAETSTGIRLFTGDGNTLNGVDLSSGALRAVINNNNEVALAGLSHVTRISSAGVPEIVVAAGCPSCDFGQTLFAGHNDAGEIAFGADVISAPDAFVSQINSIYTGASPDDKVIAVGDSLFGGTVVDLWLGSDQLNNVGQMVFIASVDGPEPGWHVVRADPPGTSSENPQLPDETIGDDFIIRLPPIVAPGVPGWYDPVVAIGYEYFAEDGLPNFASVTLPAQIGDGLYDLFLFDDSGGILDPGVVITGGQQFDLTSLDPNGFSAFRISGIEVSAGLDPTDPTAFVTGLTYVATAPDGGTLRMRPISLDVTAVPEPATLALFGLGLASVVVATRPRRNARRSRKGLEVVRFLVLP